MNRLVRRLFLFAIVAAGTACRRSGAAVAQIPSLPFKVDTVRTHAVRPGAAHWFIYAASGPWAIHALVIDRDACHSARAVKGGDAAIGRARTSDILVRLDSSTEVIGGVNADFFLFAPAGVPTGAFISNGRVITGPTRQPVLAFDSLGAPSITTLTARVTLMIAGKEFEVTGWNRRAPGGVALFDATWGSMTDTSSSVRELAFAGTPAQVTAIDSAPAGVTIPRDGGVVVTHRPPATRLRVGDSVRVTTALVPAPTEAVGGRPVLLRDSAIVSAVDTEGGPGFATGRHPRTAVGIARDGRRLLLVVVDGRQKPYSDGMTLRELAHLMLALGARDAINLDGGGSTTMVLADSTSRSLRVVNRPSDVTGERPVGNALAIVRGCARR